MCTCMHPWSSDSCRVKSRFDSKNYVSSFYVRGVSSTKNISFFSGGTVRLTVREERFPGQMGHQGPRRATCPPSSSLVRPRPWGGGSFLTPQKPRACRVGCCGLARTRTAPGPSRLHPSTKLLGLSTGPRPGHCSEETQLAGTSHVLQAPEIGFKPALLPHFLLGCLHRVACSPPYLRTKTTRQAGAGSGDPTAAAPDASVTGRQWPPCPPPSPHSR